MNSFSKKEIRFYLFFFRQIKNPIIYVLMISTCLAFLMGKIADALVVLFVVLLNVLIGFFQEFKALLIIRDLSKMLPEKTTVIRNGTPKLIHS